MRWRPHLVGEQHHDGVVPRPRRRVLDCEGVVVVLDDVEVDVSLGWAHHSRGALDPNADVSCRGRQRASSQSFRGRGASAETLGLTLARLAAVHGEVGGLA